METPDPVRAAFAAMPRELFLPPRVRHRAAYDGPLEIGHGQTNSQPRTVEDMLRLLDVRRGQRVLDVGAGSGWTTALLGHLAGPDGEVVGVEIVPELAAFGAANLAKTAQPWTRLVRAEPGRFGLPEAGPFDRILVSAEIRELPDELVDQLAVGGRMVIPVGGRMLVVDRTERGTEVERHGWYSFVPLVRGR